MTKIFFPLPLPEAICCFSTISLVGQQARVCAAAPSVRPSVSGSILHLPGWSALTFTYGD